MNRFSKSKVTDCEVINLPKVSNPSGNITPLNSGTDLPFSVKRVYYLYDVPGGEERGGHAHLELEQYIVAASGSFDVVINDGVDTKTVSLNRPYQALHIIPGIWRELVNFSSGSVCLVLASLPYDEADYIRDINDFKQMKL
jgi:hypothetical protein